MVQYSDARLDATFNALSDRTRRRVLVRLGRKETSLTRLAGHFRMSVTGMKKHVAVLERAGLVKTQKHGRVRTCALGPRRLDVERAWVDQYHQLWDARFDALDALVQDLAGKEKHR